MLLHQMIQYCIISYDTNLDDTITYYIIYYQTLYHMYDILKYHMIQFYVI